MRAKNEALSPGPVPQVFFIRLGVRIEAHRARPSRAQQRTRTDAPHPKAETTQPPEQTMDRQQKRFDEFRRIYKEERPHEARASRAWRRSTSNHRCSTGP